MDSIRANNFLRKDYSIINLDIMIIGRRVTGEEEGGV